MNLTHDMLGMSVYSKDGKELGKLKEIRGDAMCLDVPRAFDYWLPTEVAESSNAGRIVLRLNEDDIEDYRLGEPDVRQREDVRSPVSGIGGDSMPAEDTVGVTVGWADVSPRFREQWRVQYEKTASWEEMEPGFHFGYDMALDPRYMGRTFDDSEFDLRSEYPDWSRQNRYQADDGAWDRVKEGAREAWTTRRAA